MSNLIGTHSCPKCGSADWRIENWETYLSVVCAFCGCKAGELPPLSGQGRLGPLAGA